MSAGVPPTVERILVTGLPRSGTTLVGSLLGQSPLHREVWEPFNSVYRRGIDDYWPYIGPSSPPEKVARYEQLVADTLALRLRGVRAPAIGPASLRRKLARTFGTSRADVDYLRLRLADRFDPRPGRILKDPVAALLSGFLAREHGVAVVVCQRHPAAQYLSLRNRRWPPDDMRGVFAQPDAVADLFEASELHEFRSSNDIAYRFGIRYRVINRYVRSVVDATRHLGSTTVVHEDLVAEPAEEVRRLAEGLGIDPAPLVARAVELTSGTRSEHPSDDLSVVVSRDAHRAANAWKDELPQPVIDALLRGAGDAYLG